MHKDLLAPANIIIVTVIVIIEALNNKNKKRFVGEEASPILCRFRIGGFVSIGTVVIKHQSYSPPQVILHFLTTHGGSPPSVPFHKAGSFLIGYET
jgi:hypothetical protein